MNCIRRVFIVVTLCLSLLGSAVAADSISGIEESLKTAGDAVAELQNTYAGIDSTDVDTYLAVGDLLASYIKPGNMMSATAWQGGFYGTWEFIYNPIHDSGDIACLWLCRDSDGEYIAYCTANYDYECNQFENFHRLTLDTYKKWDSELGNGYTMSQEDIESGALYG